MAFVGRALQRRRSLNLKWDPAVLMSLMQRADVAVRPERQDGHEHGLLVHVPAEQEGAQSAEHQAAQETPGAARTQPDTERRRLQGQETEQNAEVKMK